MNNELKICRQTPRKKIKQKYQILLGLIAKDFGTEIKDYKKYNKKIEEEAERIYLAQFKG